MKPTERIAHHGGGPVQDLHLFHTETMKLYHKPEKMQLGIKDKYSDVLINPTDYVTLKQRSDDCDEF